MSFIRFDEQGEPTTPPTGKAILYVDQVDNEVAVKKDDGSVQKFLAGAVDDVNGETGSVSIFDILEPHEASNNTVVSAGTETFQNALTLSTSALTGGDYRVEWSFLWRHNATNTDAIVEIQIGGTTVWQMRVEPKDSGADQRHPAAGFEIVTLPAGTVDIEMNLRTSDDDDTTQLRTMRLSLVRWR